MRIIVSENGVFSNEICGLMSPQLGLDPSHWHNALYRIKAMQGACQKSAITSPWNC